MKTSLIVVDGILRKLTGASPIPEGVRLYQSLAKTGSVVLLGTGPADQHTLDWLDLHGCVHHDFVWWWPEADPHARVDQVNRLRRRGYDIDLVVEPDPAAAAGLIGAGFNTMVFVHSQYSHPAWRPDTDPGVRPWDDIARQVADQARMKAADSRLRSDDA